MRALESALSAIRVSQQALQTIGNNIANASTPGYHRQRVDLVDRRPFNTGSLSIGQGVDVGQIKRLRLDAVETALLRSTSDSGRLTADVETLRHIESLFTPGPGSLHAHMQDFFNQWELLSTQPTEGVRRQEVLQSALAITNSINSLNQGLTDLKADLQAEINEAVEVVNGLSEQVAQLHQEIRLAEARGVTPNDLYDQHDRLVTQLSDLIGADVVDAGASRGVRLASGESIVTSRAQALQVEVVEDGRIQIHVGENPEPVLLTGGRLAALVDGHNATVPEFQARLDHLTSRLVAAVNTVHASGLGAGGALSQASTDFPIQAGDLFIGVTDQSTGERILHRVPVDPATDSLNDVVSTLDGLPGLNAQVDVQTGLISIDTNAGFSLDLTGGLPSTAIIDSASGTSVPEVSGQYLGSDNDEWTLTVSGSGDVGVDTDISIAVRDSAGTIIATANVGQGYAPGDTLEIAEGVTVQLPAGMLVDGDTFRLPIVAEPDTAGVFAAWGVNDLFTGTRPGTLGINEAILNDPSRLSVSQSGEAGDNRIATRLAALAGRPLLEGDLTIAESLARISGDSGVFVAHAENELFSLSQLSTQLAGERDSFSGVNPDEELVQMLEFQRMFQTAARFMTSVNETFDELLGLVR